MVRSVSDRRQHARIILETEAELSLGSLTNGCYVQNISRGGALIYCNHEAESNETGTLHLELSTNNEINLDCKIRARKKLTDRRRTVLEIGKNISFTHAVSIQFKELMEEALFDRILKEC